MLPALIRRPGRHIDYRKRERGVTMALVALSMVGVVSMAALSVDIGSLYQAKSEAQRSADAAALAAARVLSVSGMTGDPTNSTGYWSNACATATAAAQAIGNQNSVGGAVPTSVTVTFSANDGSGCGSTGAVDFGVNPLVTVKVAQSRLRTFFARVFGLFNSNYSTVSVSGSATAEAFNPSYSGNFDSASLGAGNLIPVQPRCVKPWIVPDRDPIHPAGCTGVACQKLVQADGSITNPGITLNGAAGGGVIGEQFNLVPDCNTSGLCNSATPPFNLIAQANVTGVPETPNLQYLPALVSNASPAASSCAVGDYQQSIAGCDTTTAYQCGVPSTVATTQTLVNLNENPYGPTGDTGVAAQCLIHESGSGLGNGQDLLVDSSFPFQIQAGSGNPLGVSGSTITSSTSIVSLPIYESTSPLPPGQQQAVTIIGFLQVFINQVNPDGSLNVTVLNLSGCSNISTSTSPFVTGSSPVPIRLITPP